MKQQNQPTIRDVSRIANVSMSTVSHVINGTKNVTEETAEKVLRAIEQTGYTQNYLAKAFKMNCTKTIGLVISDIRNQYFIDVIDSIYEEALKEGYMVMLTNSNDNSGQELEVVKSLYERRVDGLILSPTIYSDIKTVPFINQNKIPVVYIDRHLNIESDWVGSENINAARNLTNYLIGLGHKKIAMVAGLYGINTTEERIIGYKQALEEHGIPFNKDYIIYGESKSEPSKLMTKLVLGRLMNTEDCPTAIISANNLMALGTMRALQELKLKVPKDISLASFDDFEWSDLFQPKLTTIAQPCDEIGKKAVKLLLNRINNPESPFQNISLDPKLIIRESTGKCSK